MNRFAKHKMLKIENLHATVADKPILKGLSLDVERGRDPCDHGAERRGQVDARPMCSAGGPVMRSTDGVGRPSG